MSCQLSRLKFLGLDRQFTQIFSFIYMENSLFSHKSLGFDMIWTLKFIFLILVPK